MSVDSPSCLTRLPNTSFITPINSLSLRANSRNAGSTSYRSNDSPPLNPASEDSALNSFKSSKVSRLEKKIPNRASSRTTMSLPLLSLLFTAPNSPKKISISSSLSRLLITRSNCSRSPVNFEATLLIWSTCPRFASSSRISR